MKPVMATRARNRWRIAALAVWAAALPLAASSAAPAAFERVDLFESGVGGYAYYRIPGMVVTAKGTVLAYCEGRLDSRGDWANIDVLLRRSTDGGKTWGPVRKMSEIPGPKEKNPIPLAQKLARPDEVTYTNGCAIAARDGTVHFFFCLEFNHCYYQRSSDDGLTFSPPVEITSALAGFRREYDWKVLNAGPTHGIELANGRLLLPVGLSTGTSPGGFKPSVVAVAYSDDHGQTWQTGDIAVGTSAAGPNPNCAVLVQLADGRVMLNVRTETKLNRRMVCWSKDGATGWSAPSADPALVEPICEASIVRLSTEAAGGRNRILFANPDNLENASGHAAPGGSRDRKNLSVKLTYDEGKTWPVSRAIEPGPSAYSDLAVLPDGTVLCLFERGAQGGNLHKPTHLSVARFNLEWLTGGKDSLGTPSN